MLCGVADYVLITLCGEFILLIASLKCAPIVFGALFACSVMMLSETGVFAS